MIRNNLKIPDGWCVKKLGDLCVSSPDYGLNLPAIPLNKKFPLYLRITDIDEMGYYLNQGNVSVEYNNVDKILNDGDFLFARTGATVGKTFLYKDVGKKIAFAGYLIRFIPDKNKIIPYYLSLSCQIKTYWDWIDTYKARSGQPGVNAEEYSTYPILLPPLPEQEKIADILGCWDTAIEKLTALIDAKKQRKKALMQNLLTAKIRLPGFTDEWKSVKLGNVCTTFSGGTPAKNEKKFWKNGSIKWISAKYIEDGKIVGYDLITEEGLKSSSSKLAERGDIIIVTRVSVGKMILCEDDFAINQDMTVIRSEKFLNMFLFNSLKNKTDEIINKSQGLAIKGITRDDLDEIDLNIPSLPEQQAIADILSKADEEIDLLTKKLFLIQEQKKGLMQKLLTGQIRVKVV